MGEGQADIKPCIVPVELIGKVGIVLLSFGWSSIAASKQKGCRNNCYDVCFHCITVFDAAKKQKKSAPQGFARVADYPVIVSLLLFLY